MGKQSKQGTTITPTGVAAPANETPQRY